MASRVPAESYKLGRTYRTGIDQQGTLSALVYTTHSGRSAACQLETADSTAYSTDIQIAEQERRLATMANDHHSSSAPLAPHAVLKCDLLPTPQHSTPTPCFKHHTSHCITTHYTTCCLVITELFYSCVSLALPPLCLYVCARM